MRYLGSKVSVVEQIFDHVSQKISKGTFCDPFGGMGIVGSFFKRKGYNVWSGDILTFAHYFQIARIKQNDRLQLIKLYEELGLASSESVTEILNRSRLKNGWFTEEYSLKRSFFTKTNAERIEASWLLIQLWRKKGWLKDNEYSVLIASLINSMDKVANTAGTYYAYLKTWHRKALLPFKFEMIDFTPGSSDCDCFLTEAKYLVDRNRYDVLYLDPPFNERCYNKYYHLPETIALGETPNLHGLSGMPDLVRTSSDFNKPRTAQEALSDLLKEARFRLLAFHYSDNGLITPSRVREILSSHGQVREITLKCQGYTTSKASRITEHRLYLVSHE